MGQNVKKFPQEIPIFDKRVNFFLILLLIFVLIMFTLKYTAPYIFVLVSICYFQFFISVLELIFLLIAYLTSVQTCFLPTLCLQANIFQCFFFPPSRKMSNSLSLILRKTVLLNCNVTAPFFFRWMCVLL